MNRRSTTLIALLSALIGAHLVACAVPPPPPTIPAPTATPSPIPTRSPTAAPSPTPSPTPLPTLPVPTPLATLPALGAPLATPFPDVPQIVEAVVRTPPAGDSRHWSAHAVSGSFTAPGADEVLALVGNLGRDDEFRWIIVGRTGRTWELRGVSDALGFGFDAPPPAYFTPELLDFDGDGLQEVLVYTFRMEGGWMGGGVAMYRWDGRRFARVWELISLLDDTLAELELVPNSYRQSYQAEWRWADLDGAPPDEIVVSDRVIFYPISDDSDSALGADHSVVTAERAFRWDGTAFRPYAPDGPVGTFAFTLAGSLWLWEARGARQLQACPPDHAIAHLAWSEDGRWLAWGARPNGPYRAKASLGLFDRTGGEMRWLGLPADVAALTWTPDGRIAFQMEGQANPVTLLDPRTGAQEGLAPLGLLDWSLSQEWLAYTRSDGLYLYNPFTGQERRLVAAAHPSENLDAIQWSPQGDTIALRAWQSGRAAIGLLRAGSSQTTSFALLAAPFAERAAPRVQGAWSPDGTRYAALSSGTATETLASVLYVGTVPAPGADPQWPEVLRLPAAMEPGGPAWSPDGQWVAVAVGGEVWLTDITGAAMLRHAFAYPQPRWSALAWAPDGSGLLGALLHGGEGRLHWFPSSGAEPVLLLDGQIGTVAWAPLP